jgi:hypothetical protein
MGGANRCCASVWKATISLRQWRPALKVGHPRSLSRCTRICRRYACTAFSFDRPTSSQRVGKFRPIVAGSRSIRGRNRGGLTQARATPRVDLSQSSSAVAPSVLAPDRVAVSDRKPREQHAEQSRQQQPSCRGFDDSGIGGRRVVDDPSIGRRHVVGRWRNVRRNDPTPRHARRKSGEQQSRGRSGQQPGRRRLDQTRRFMPLRRTGRMRNQQPAAGHGRRDHLAHQFDPHGRMRRHGGPTVRHLPAVSHNRSYEAMGDVRGTARDWRGRAMNDSPANRGHNSSPRPQCP